MLVWNAMPSITPMMSAIRVDEVCTCRMLSITWAMVLPPWSATVAFSLASWETARVVSADCSTVDEICSIAEADSSRLAAACSLRWLRSVEALAISSLAWTRPCDAVRTSVTMPRRECCICASVVISAAASSEPQGRGVVVRSPSVIALRWRSTSARPPRITRKKLWNRYSTSSSEPTVIASVMSRMRTAFRSRSTSS